MNDQMILDEYLLLLKSNVEVYVHGTLESSNSSVRERLKETLDETMSMQAHTYDEMVKKGWYTVENVKEKAIEKVIQKVS